MSEFFENCNPIDPHYGLFNMRYCVDITGIYSDAFIHVSDKLKEQWGEPLITDYNRPSATFMDVEPVKPMAYFSQSIPGKTIQYVTAVGMDSETMIPPNWILAIVDPDSPLCIGSDVHWGMLYFRDEEVAESFESIYIELKLTSGFVGA